MKKNIETRNFASLRCQLTKKFFSIGRVGGVQVITTPLVLSFAPLTVLRTILSLFGVAVLAGGLLIGIQGKRTLKRS